MVGFAVWKAFWQEDIIALSECFFYLCHWKGWNSMGKDLKGKELGQGISQRKDGRYCGRYTDRFGQRHSVYSHKLSELRSLLNNAIYENEKRLNVYNERMTVNDWYESWIELYKKDTIRQTSLANYMFNYRKYIADRIGFMRLQDVNTAHIQKLVNDLNKEGLSYKSVCQVRIILVDMFEKAILSEFMLKNPAKNVTLAKGKKKERRVLTVEEQQTFLEAAVGNWYEPLFHLALLTGLRQGELCALTWDDIDFENKVMVVSKTLIYSKDIGEKSSTFKINPPKTEQGNRAIPLTNEAIAVLECQRRQYEWLNGEIKKRKNIKPVKGFEKLIFKTRIASPITERSFRESIKTVVRNINKNRKEGEEEFADFSPHTFRHTFATRCFENGVQPKVIQELMGHSSMRMTMDLYTHVTEEKKRTEIELNCIGMLPTGVKLV